MRLIVSVISFCSLKACATAGAPSSCLKGRRPRAEGVIKIQGVIEERGGGNPMGSGARGASMLSKKCGGSLMMV